MAQMVEGLSCELSEFKPQCHQKKKKDQFYSMNCYKKVAIIYTALKYLHSIFAVPS
jgi:hypothetical protein